MPGGPVNPFKGRHYSGEIILLAVRWYLRYPLAYQHVAEMLAERGLAVDASCIWRWVQAYAPELKKTMPAASASHQQIVPDRRDIYKDQGRGSIPVSRAGLHRADDRFSVDGEAGHGGGQTLSGKGDR